MYRFVWICFEGRDVGAVHHWLGEARPAWVHLDVVQGPRRVGVEFEVVQQLQQLQQHLQQQQQQHLHEKQVQLLVSQKVFSSEILKMKVFWRNLFRISFFAQIDTNNIYPTMYFLNNLDENFHLFFSIRSKDRKVF